MLFTRVTRNDADKDIPHLIKYLLNFAFYKFGVEITLLTLTILVCGRMDIIGILYAIWLCILFGISRETKHRIWPIFQSFIVIMIVIQYIFAVNLPPFLCIGMFFNGKLCIAIQNKIGFLSLNFRLSMGYGNIAPISRNGLVTRSNPSQSCAQACI